MDNKILGETWKVQINRQPLLQERLDMALKLSNPRPGIKILDIGCGSGRYVAECAKRGADSWGIDFSPEMIKLAKEYCKINNLRSHLLTGDAKKELPQGFDVCIAMGVIEYYKNPKIILNNMASATKTGGKVLFTAPKLYAFRTLIRKAWMKYRNVYCGYYNTNKIKNLLKNETYIIYDCGIFYFIEWHIERTPNNL